MKRVFPGSDRLENLPPYIFSELNRIKADAQKRGISLTSLAIGDPDLPTPSALVAQMQLAIAKPSNHTYSDYDGRLSFRSAVARWFHQRFDVSLDPQNEIIALIGTKEGVAHFPMAFCNPGDKCLVPSPGYPVFESSVLLAGATPIKVPHQAEKSFLPDLEVLEKLMALHRPKLMILNYPSNPTSVTCSKQQLAEIVDLAKKYRVIVASDLAYSEIYYDPQKRPHSILEIAGAKEIAIEFHSFSKTFNMTGWRLGFAVGNPDLVAGLLKFKTNVDSGPLLSVQEVGEFALAHYEELTQPIRNTYSQRREAIVRGLKKFGIEHINPEATFFVWCRVPGGLKSMDFARQLIEKQGLVVTPGIGFGEEGDGFFRIAMTQSVEALEACMERLGNFCS